jgi:hypothetical protein
MEYCGGIGNIRTHETGILGRWLMRKVSGRVEELSSRKGGSYLCGRLDCYFDDRLPYRGFPTYRLPRRSTIPFQLHNPVQVYCGEMNHLDGDLYLDIFISSKWIFLAVIFRVMGGSITNSYACSVNRLPTRMVLYTAQRSLKEQAAIKREA